MKLKNVFERITQQAMPKALGGFTLAEVLITLAIIGVIAVLSIGIYG